MQEVNELFRIKKARVKIERADKVKLNGLHRKHCQVEVQEKYFWTSFSNNKKIS
jgi:hypothetical protein